MSRATFSPPAGHTRGLSQVHLGPQPMLRPLWGPEGQAEARGLLRATAAHLVAHQVTGEDRTQYSKRKGCAASMAEPMTPTGEPANDGLKWLRTQCKHPAQQTSTKTRAREQHTPRRSEGKRSGPIRLCPRAVIRVGGNRYFWMRKDAENVLCSSAFDRGPEGWVTARISRTGAATETAHDQYLDTET